MFGFLSLAGLLSATLAQGQTADKPIQVVKERVLELEQRERQLLGTLYSINQRMKDMSRRRDRLTDRKLAAEGDVRSLARVTGELEKRIDQQRRSLSTQVRQLYLLNGQSVMRTLFSSQSAMELDRNLRYLKRFTDRSYSMIKTFERTLNTFRTKRRQLDSQVRHLAKVQGALTHQESALVKEQETKGSILSRLKSSRELHLSRLKDIRQNLPAQQRLGPEFDTSFFETRGQLPAPVDGQLVKTYGYVEDKSYRFRLAHKGLHFNTKVGEKVRAVFRGQVAFAGELPGYGLSVILDHGDHYYTVYAHLVSLAIKAGAQIQGAGILGEAGAPSLWFGQGLYFEVRHFSDAIDPEPWIKMTTKRETNETNT